MHSCYCRSAYAIDHTSTDAGGACKISSQSEDKSKSNQGLYHPDHHTIYSSQHPKLKLLQVSSFNKALFHAGPNSQILKQLKPVNVLLKIIECTKSLLTLQLLVSDAPINFTSI